MTFVVQRTVRGRENHAPGSPAGRENMQSGVQPPVQRVVTAEMGSTVSASIAWATNVATVTATAHGLSVGDLARIAGATESYFNGDFRVDSVADANTFTYAVYGADLASSASGSPTCRLLKNRPGL
jgi:hypothetical protein